jgi:hypothetical protein
VSTRARLNRLWRRLGPSASCVLTLKTPRELRPYCVDFGPGVDPDEPVQVWLPRDWRPPYNIEDKRYKYNEN